MVVEGCVKGEGVGGEDSLVGLHHQVPAPHLHISNVPNIHQVLHTAKIYLKERNVPCSTLLIRPNKYQL
jgi:hypothetical protein